MISSSSNSKIVYFKRVARNSLSTTDDPVKKPLNINDRKKFELLIWMPEIKDVS